MSGKAGYTLAGLGATYAATQLGCWTGFVRARNRMKGRRRNYQRQPYFPVRSEGKGKRKRSNTTQTSSEDRCTPEEEAASVCHLILMLQSWIQNSPFLQQRRV